MLPQSPITNAPTMDQICSYISSVEVDALLSNLEFPAVEEGAYSRLPLLKEPFEVTAIKWPPKGMSAIHKHEGFYGAVRVLEGRIINRAYIHEAGVLKEVEVTEFTANGVVEEPDGTIHLLENVKKLKKKRK